MYKADSWEDMTDNAGNTLHIVKLEYTTKHGKEPVSFWDKVFPKGCKVCPLSGCEPILGATQG